MAVDNLAAGMMWSFISQPDGPGRGGLGMFRRQDTFRAPGPGVQQGLAHNFTMSNHSGLWLGTTRALGDTATTMAYLDNLDGLMPTNASANETSTDTRPEFVDYSLSIVFYSLAFIIPMGLVCNTLSICVFMSRPLRTRAASWYLAALAVSDDLSLLTIMAEYWLKDPRIGLPIVKDSEILCIMITYCSYSSRLLSAWLVMTFTIERFIGVVFPLQRAALSSTAHARKVILCECIACFVLTSYTTFTIGVVKASYGKECDVLPGRSTMYLIFNIIFLIIGSIVIPILVIFTLNMFMLHKVCQHKRTFTRKNLRFASARVAASKANRDFNVATLLLVVSTTFVILNAPYCVAWFILFIQHSQSTSSELRWDLFAAKYITSVPYYLNYSINFALYSLCARAFRQSVTAILTCRHGLCACCLGRDGGPVDTKQTVMEFYMENRNVDENGHRVIVAIRSKSKSRSRSSSSKGDKRAKRNHNNNGNKQTPVGYNVLDPNV